MSQTLSNMIENTLSKIKDMISVNDVVGTPITTPEGVTIIPMDWQILHRWWTLS